MNDKTNPNQGAFATSNDKYHQAGCSKREYFAAMAMQGLISSSNDTMIQINAKIAVKAADALIKALNE